MVLFGDVFHAALQILPTLSLQDATRTTSTTTSTTGAQRSPASDSQAVTAVADDIFHLHHAVKRAKGILQSREATAQIPQTEVLDILQKLKGLEAQVAAMLPGNAPDGLMVPESGTAKQDCDVGHLFRYLGVDGRNTSSSTVSDHPLLRRSANCTADEASAAQRMVRGGVSKLSGPSPVGSGSASESATADRQGDATQDFSPGKAPSAASDTSQWPPSAMKQQSQQQQQQQQLDPGSNGSGLPKNGVSVNEMSSGAQDAPVPAPLSDGAASASPPPRMASTGSSRAKGGIPVAPPEQSTNGAEVLQGTSSNSPTLTPQPMDDTGDGTLSGPTLSSASKLATPDDLPTATSITPNAEAVKAKAAADVTPAADSDTQMTTITRTRTRRTTITVVGFHSPSLTSKGTLKLYNKTGFANSTRFDNGNFTKHVNGSFAAKGALLNLTNAADAIGESLGNASLPLNDTSAFDNGRKLLGAASVNQSKALLEPHAGSEPLSDSGTARQTALPYSTGQFQRRILGTGDAANLTMVRKAQTGFKTVFTATSSVGSLLTS